MLRRDTESDCLPLMRLESNVEMLCATFGVASEEQQMASKLPNSALPHSDRINRSAIFILGCRVAPTLAVCWSTHSPHSQRSCTDTCKTPRLHSRDTAKQTKSASAPWSGSPSLAASHPSRYNNYKNCSHLFPLRILINQEAPRPPWRELSFPFRRKRRRRSSSCSKRRRRKERLKSARNINREKAEVYG